MPSEKSTHHPGQIATTSEITSILTHFPPGITHAIGYGSGVFSQTNDNIPDTTIPKKSPPMLDLIFITSTHPHKFHAENLKRHPHHYAPMLRTLGPNAISTIQTSIPARLFFNPLVSVENNRLLKYGVIYAPHAMTDLKEWEFLYLAGRLQKPTLQGFEGYTDPAILTAQKGNLSAAVAAGLLISLSRSKSSTTMTTITLPEVFESVCRLSYDGDPRTLFKAEDPRKIQKLVRSNGQYERFCSLYAMPLDELQSKGLITVSSSDDGEYSTSVMIDGSSSARLEFERYLPAHFRGVAGGAACASTLAMLLRRTVARGAWGQTVKGFFTAGLGKSLRYGGAKLKKGGWRVF